MVLTFDFRFKGLENVLNLFKIFIASRGQGLKIVCA